MDEPAGDGAPIDRVLDLDGLRLILVDSTRPGRGDGFFSEEQAAWLSEVLASPAPAGTVLAIHHPPLPTADEFMAEYAFRDRARFSASIAGSDIRLIVSGHWHQPGGGNLAGYPIWIGGSTATTTRPARPQQRAVRRGVERVTHRAVRRRQRRGASGADRRVGDHTARSLSSARWGSRARVTIGLPRCAPRSSRTWNKARTSVRRSRSPSTARWSSICGAEPSTPTRKPTFPGSGTRSSTSGRRRRR